MQTLTAVAITTNTILGNQVSPFLIQDLKNLKTTGETLGVDFTTDAEAVTIVELEVEKMFKKQLMKPRGEMYQAAVAFIIGR